MKRFVSFKTRRLSFRSASRTRGRRSRRPSGGLLQFKLLRLRLRLRHPRWRVSFHISVCSNGTLSGVKHEGVRANLQA
eukprot:8079113-Pyramimonas_sp.AAC.1